MKNKILIIFLGIFFTLLFIELLFRVSGYSRPNHYMYDKNIGATHRPNAKGWFKKENLIYVNINSDGILGPERKVEKLEGVFRIAILGDSFAEGLQVNYGDRFSEIIERKLNICLNNNKKYEVINFAVSGMAQTRQILTYRYKAKKYNPDLVILLLHPGNDIRDNHPILNGNKNIPYYVFDDKKNIYLDDSFKYREEFKKKLIWSNSLHNLSNHIRITHPLWEFYNYIKIKQILFKPKIKLNDKEDGGIFSNNKILDEAWLLTEKQIELFSKELANDNVGFVLTTTITGKYEKFNIEKERIKIIDNYNFLDKKFINLSEENNFSYFSLKDYFVEQIIKNKKSIHYFDFIKREGGHWNEFGHRLAGEKISNSLCKLIN